MKRSVLLSLVLMGVSGGLAAWLVVFYHIRLALPDSVPPGVIAVLAKGYLAVAPDIFWRFAPGVELNPDVEAELNEARRGSYSRTIKNVTFNEPHFQGHFPGRPIMPGVLIVEAMAQVGGVVLTQLADIPVGLFMFAGIDKVRFRRPVVPGDQLVMTVELLTIKRRRFGKMQGRAEVDGQLATDGELMFSLVD